MFFPLLALFCIEASAELFTDLNCTKVVDGVIQYASTAFNCENYLTDASCIVLYPPSNSKDFPAGYVEGNTTHRPLSCFAYQPTGRTAAPELKAQSLKTCPKRCGFCCQTPEFSCSNAQFPRLNCATITKSQCLSPVWRTIIASDCPSSCGFCLTGGCVDSVPSCANDISICTAAGMQNFVNKNCQRTCGRCSSSTVASSIATAPCTPQADSSRNCALWKANGFCRNSFYTQTQKKAYCARTCGIC